MLETAVGQGRNRAWSVVAVVALFASLLAISLAFWGGATPYVFTDLDIYRASLRSVAAGTSNTYAALPYPPIAFVALSFLAYLPPVLGDQVWTALEVALILVISLVLSMRTLEIQGRDRRAERWTLTALTATAALLLLTTRPVVSQITAGQMSLVVMSLAFIDLCGVLPRRYRGALVGVAGALKVTPLIFVVYYLATGQRRKAAVATGSFAIVTGIGWAIFPAASWQFWTRVGGSDQFGDPARHDNLSIHSMLTRISPELGAQSWLWLLLGAAVMISALWRARVHFQRDEKMESFLTVAVAATVVAPIAWPHYFVWLPVLAVWLWFTGRGRARVVSALIYLAYSEATVARILTPLADAHPRSASVIDILVLIPMAIGIFGLPHRPTPLPVPGDSPEPASWDELALRP